MEKLRKNFLAVVAGVSLSTAGSLCFPAEVSVVTNDKTTDVAEQFNASAQKCEISEGMAGGIVAKERSCLTLSAFLEDPEAHKDEPGYDALMAIYNSSSFSREMLERVAETDPQMRLCDMELSSGIAAIYNGVRIGVDFERDQSTAFNVSNIVHEMAHHYQTLNGANYFDYRRTLADNQRAVLALETTAPVAEWVALHTAEQAGTIDWKSELDSYDMNFYYMFKFSMYYQAQINAGLDPDEALNATAKHSWQEVLKNQSKLDFYNKAVVRFTLLQMDFLKSDYVDRWAPDLDHTISTSGAFTDKINFTTLSAMPESKDLFGKNEALRDIYEAVEWYRLSYMLGSENLWVNIGHQNLKAAQNPYAEVDFAAVACKVRQGVDVQAAFDNAIPAPAVQQAAAVRKSAAPGTGL